MKVENKNYRYSCINHGLAILDAVRNDRSLTISFCRNIKNPIMRSIYSERSKLWIILYWYEAFSTVNATVLVSITKCKFIKFDPCKFVQNCFSLGADCPLYLKKLTKNTTLNLVSTQSWEPELFFSLPDGQCVNLVVMPWLSRRSLEKAHYRWLPLCDCCVSLISDPGRNLISSVRGKLIFSLKYKIKSIVEVVGTIQCSSKNCKRIFGGEEIRSYKFLKKAGFIWMKENYQEIHGLKIQIFWRAWRLNWLEVILTGHKGVKPRYLGFTEEAENFVEIKYLLGMLIMPRNILGMDMVFSTESESSSNISSRYFRGNVANARYLLLDRSIFTSKYIALEFL